jgi:hypothetical protein
MEPILRSITFVCALILARIKYGRPGLSPVKRSHVGQVPIAEAEPAIEDILFRGQCSNDEANFILIAVIDLQDL